MEHAWQLRAQIRAREPRLTLGGWANPYADAAQQVEYMTDDCFNAEYYLTQIVSHLDIAPWGGSSSRRGGAASASQACSASSTIEAPTQRPSER